MKKKELFELKEWIMNLKEEEKRERNLYLLRLAKGQIIGPKIGYASIDKPWLKCYQEKIFDLEIPNTNIYNCMVLQNHGYTNRIAINYFGKKMTYGELFQKVDDLTQKFSALGVKCGDIVSICMPTTPETAMSFYALNRLGAVCDMIDPRSNSGQLDYYLSENKSKLLIVCENYINVMKDAINKHVKDGILEKVINLPITPSAPFMIKLLVDYKVKKKNGNQSLPDNTITWNDFLQIEGNKEYVEKMNPDDTAIIVHSSGTTSTPKGIMLSNKNINAIALQYKNTSLKTDPGSKFLSVIPAFASFGMVTSINLPLYLQMENIMMPMVNADLFCKAFKKNKINFCLTVPGNFLALARSKRKYDLTGLYGPGAGGYSLDSTKEEEINKYLKDHDAPVPMLMGWGMSEAASTICLETPECAKTLSSGIPLPLNIVGIFYPDTDLELPYGVEGEICVSGPTIMQKYLNNPEKTNKVKKIHSDGSLWLHSGDIGYMDLDGRVYPIDRCERMIIKGIDGFKMFPQKMEDVIGSSKYVHECVVVGYNTHEKGVVAKAWIMLEEEYKGDYNEAARDIYDKCLSKLSERQIPDLAEFIDEIPYTPLGKPDYKKLEKQEASCEFNLSSGELINEKKFQKVKKI